MGGSLSYLGDLLYVYSAKLNWPPGICNSVVLVSMKT